jgi:hypothetical protein
VVDQAGLACQGYAGGGTRVAGGLGDGEDDFSGFDAVSQVPAGEAGQVGVDVEGYLG